VGISYDAERKGVEVLCFKYDMEVFIPRDLGADFVAKVVTAWRERRKNRLERTTLPPGVFGKECAALTKEKGWTEL
jgi:hypothetical protein